MTKWLPTIIAVGTLVATAISPTVQTFWQAHAVAAGIAGSVAAIVNHLLPSPMSSK